MLKTDVIVGGLYRHFKGGIYRVVGIAKHTETEEELVIYESANDKKQYARPIDMFIEDLNRDGETVQRFRPIVGKQDESKY